MEWKALKRLACIFWCMVGVVIVAGIIPAFLFAQESDEISSELQARVGWSHGIRFVVPENEYLDVILDSSVPITARIDSVPNTITLNVKRSSDNASSVFSFSQLKPLTEYYIYEDGYQNVRVLMTDNKGILSYSQDLRDDHILFILEEPSTYFIKDNVTGGQCTLIGHWNMTTKTCTFTTDISDRIQILDDGITLDGNDHTLSGNFSGAGIFYTRQNNITIRNLTIEGFTYGVLAHQSDKTTIVDSVFINNRRALSLQESTESSAERNVVHQELLSHTSQHGFDILDSTGTKIIDNTFLMNVREYPWLTKIGIYVYSSLDTTITGNIVYGTSFGIVIDNSAYGIVLNNTIQEIENYAIVIDHSDQFSVYHNNMINSDRPARSTANTNTTFSRPFPVGGNYWSNYDSEEEGCFDTDHDFICDNPMQFQGGEDAYPWIAPSAWIDPPKPEIPETYFGKIRGGGSSGVTLYSLPDTDSLAIKNVPNHWIVQVESETDEEYDGEWVQVTDPTDGSSMWLQGGMDSAPYQEDIQDEYESLAVDTIDTKAERGTLIKEIIDHYLSNSETDPSLYSGKDTVNFPFLLDIGFPKELIYAIIAQESGGVNFDNEIVSPDYGHGVMQITFQARYNEPDNYRKNRWDNRARYSKYLTLNCKNIILNSVTGKKEGIDEYKRCYQNVDLVEDLRKPYDYYDHNPENPKYKQYVNTAQSMYANIKDGLGVLQVDKFLQKCPNEDLHIHGYTFTCKEIEKLFMVWGYNGWTTEQEFNYMREIAHQLENLSHHFPGESYANTDHLIEKLRIANDNRKTLKAYSPVEVSIIDNNGKRVGLHNGAIYDELYTGGYDSDDEQVVVLFPEDDNYIYSVRGTDTDTYGLLIESVVNGERVLFEAVDLPTTPTTTHTYTLDHDLLAMGGPGVTLSLDEDSDGIPERTLQVGDTLDDIIPPEIVMGNIRTEYIYGEQLMINDIDFTITDNKDPFPTYQISINGIDITYKESFLLQPGENILRIYAIDETGNEIEVQHQLFARYRFEGFLPPLGSNTTYVTHQTIPVKFSFSDYNGLILDSVSGEIALVNSEGGELYAEPFFPTKHGTYHQTITMDYEEDLWLELRPDDGSRHRLLITYQDH